MRGGREEARRGEVCGGGTGGGGFLVVKATRQHSTAVSGAEKGRQAEPRARERDYC